MALDEDGAKRLEIVLEYAQGDESRVRAGVEHAMNGVKERARRVYLRRALTLAALSKIRKTKRARAKPMVGIRLTPEMLRDAVLHDQSHTLPD